MIPLKIESLENYSNTLPREDELIGVITAGESGKHKLMLKDSTGSIHELSCDTSELQTALAAKANTADLAAVATSGSYSDLFNQPAIPADLSDLSDASGILSAKANLSALIQPGLTAQYEQIPVGPTRKYKTLAEAYAYMQTKNMGSKGFKLILDPGIHEGITFENTVFNLISADTSNPAVISGILNIRNSRFSLNNLSFSDAYLYVYMCYGSFISDCSLFDTTRSIGINISYCHNIHIIRTVVDMGNYPGSTGISITCSNQVLVRAGSISHAFQGFYANLNSSAFFAIIDSTATQISNTTTAIVANSMSTIHARTVDVKISHSTTSYSPASQTIGNYNSYIRTV